MIRTALLPTLALALLAPVGSVSATANDWAVVPAARGDVPIKVENLAIEIRRELERQGQRVWSPKKATTLFARKGSSEPVVLPRETLERWQEDSRAGIRTLALGEHEVALQHLRRASEMSRSAFASLNREEDRAQRVLDTCLFFVRALLEVGELGDARDQARECAFLSPSGEPQDLLHPPATLAVYEEARREGAEHAGSLVVDGERDGCTVRINGVRLGRTPFETSHLSTGVYAVQVECDEVHLGRVHFARIGVGATRLRVDTSIDRLVRTEPMLRLDYPEQSSVSSRKAAAHGIAQALPARWVVFVSQRSPNIIELDLVGDSASRMGCARLDADIRGVRSDALAIAIRNMIAGNCRDASAASSATTAAPLFIPEI